MNLFLLRGAMNDRCRLQLFANLMGAPLLLFLGLAIVSVLTVRGCAAVKKVAGEMMMLSLAAEQKMEKGRRRKVDVSKFLRLSVVAMPTKDVILRFMAGWAA